MGKAAAGEGHPSVPRLSVVVPALDEAPNLASLVTEVRDALDAAGITWELIVVDDGSVDDTEATLAALAASEPRLGYVRHARQSGQTAALVSGFAAARGALIATLDADLQCRPADLPRLVEALGDGDLACGIRVGRRDPPSRRVASFFANGARRLLLAPGLRDLACPARVLRADALARLDTPLFDGAHRWLPALFVLAGLRVTQLPVQHWPRLAGESKYTTRGRLAPIARETPTMLPLLLPPPCRVRLARVSSRARRRAPSGAGRGPQRGGGAGVAGAGGLARPAFHPPPLSRQARHAVLARRWKLRRGRRQRICRAPARRGERHRH